MGVGLLYLGFQMLLPKSAAFIISVTTEEGEIWEANYLPRAENKP